MNIDELYDLKNFLKSKEGVEVPVTNDICFKYVFSDPKLVSMLLKGLGYDIKDSDKIEIASEVAVGVVGVKVGQKRFDLKVSNFSSSPNVIYAIEMQNYKENIFFKAFFKWIIKTHDSLEKSKKIVLDIDDLEINHIIVFDNTGEQNDDRLFTKIINVEVRDGIEKNSYIKNFYDGEIITFHLNNINKFDKIDSEEYNYVKYLKSLNYNSNVLIESGDEFMCAVGSRVRAFNTDEIKREEAFEADWENIRKRAMEKEYNKKELKNTKKELKSARQEANEAKAKVVVSAKEFKKLGFSIDKIIELTGLDRKTIEEL